MFASRRRAGCPCQEVIDEVVDKTPRPVITLVHGTWAQHTWIRKKRVSKRGSASAGDLLRKLQSLARKPKLPPQTEDLYEALKRRVPDAKIYRFCWSGGNSNTKRLEAAQQLQVYLRRLQKKHPNGHLFVVSHSHGGSVSLYAMKDQALRDSIAGIITLATPFLHFNRRKFPGFVLYWNAGILFLSMIVTIVGLIGIDDDGNVVRLLTFPSPWWWLAFSVVAAGVIGVSLILLSASLYRGKEFGPLSLLGLADEHAIADELSRLRLPDVDTEKLYVVRGLGDEAAGGLASSQFLFSWLVTRLLGYLDIKRLLAAWRSLVVLLLAVSVGLGSLEIVGDAQNLLTAVALASLFVLALGGGVFAAMGLLILVLGSIPFAWDAGFLGLVAQTTAEPMPRGSVSVFQLGETAREGLEHSIQHRIRVHDLIQQWIEHKVAVRQQMEPSRAVGALGNGPQKD